MSDPAENRDVRGNTIKPHSVEAENVKAKNATVESEPSEANEIARKVDIDAKADLDSTTGVLKSSQVPDLAITSVSTVPDQSSRLSLSVEEGDVAIQTDTDTTFIFTGGDPSVNSNWSEIVLDVLDAISGSTISPDTVNANSVNTKQASVSEKIHLGSSTETIASGEISYTAPIIRVEPEGGSSDTLTRCTGGSEGSILILRGPQGDPVTVQNADGNLSGEFRLESATDVTLNTFRDRLLFEWDDGSDEWVLLSFSNYA